jgi:hypothetical protein
MVQHHSCDALQIPLGVGGHCYAWRYESFLFFFVPHLLRCEESLYFDPMLAVLILVALLGTWWFQNRAVLGDLRIFRFCWGILPTYTNLKGPKGPRLLDVAKVFQLLSRITGDLC